MLQEPGEELALRRGELFRQGTVNIIFEALRGMGRGARLAGTAGLTAFPLVPVQTCWLPVSTLFPCGVTDVASQMAECQLN